MTTLAYRKTPHNQRSREYEISKSPSDKTLHTKIGFFKPTAPRLTQLYKPSLIRVIIMASFHNTPAPTPRPSAQFHKHSYIGRINLTLKERILQNIIVKIVTSEKKLRQKDLRILLYDIRRIRTSRTTHNNSSRRNHIVNTMPRHAFVTT